MRLVCESAQCCDLCDGQSRRFQQFPSLFNALLHHILMGRHTERRAEALNEACPAQTGQSRQVVQQDFRRKMVLDGAQIFDQFQISFDQCFKTPSEGNSLELSTRGSVSPTPLGLAEEELEPMDEKMRFMDGECADRVLCFHDSGGRQLRVSIEESSRTGSCYMVVGTDGGNAVGLSREEALSFAVAILNEVNCETEN